jgi:phosphoenolpyruvate-protein kinase (PTS system EI component)
VSAHLADPLHPGVLRLIQEILKEAHAARCSVSVCGEMAAEELGAIALAALQTDSLSVAVNQYAATQQALSRVLPEDLGELRTQILRLRSAYEVRELLTAKRRPGKTPANV